MSSPVERMVVQLRHLKPTGHQATQKIVTLGLDPLLSGRESIAITNLCSSIIFHFCCVPLTRFLKCSGNGSTWMARTSRAMTEKVGNTVKNRHAPACPGHPRSADGQVAGFYRTVVGLTRGSICRWQTLKRSQCSIDHRVKPDGDDEMVSYVRSFTDGLVIRGPQTRLIEFVPLIEHAN